MSLSRWRYLAGFIIAISSSGFAGNWIRIPKGSYVPFFSRDRKSVMVDAFEMARLPVTKNQFRDFLKKNPAWTKANVKSLFADDHYLENWNQLRPGAPVTDVSWFAARSFCQSLSADLPTTDQWEYVADDHGKGIDEIKEWYSHPNPKAIPDVSQASCNGIGVCGMYDLVWEWTLDFNSGTTDPQEQANFCGAGSVGAINKSDYASFMRYSFRSSLRANYGIKNLGFRCIRQLRGAKK